MHAAHMEQLERAAILYRLGCRRDETAADIFRIVVTYAGAYTQYEIHGDRAGKGRIGPQCLDEAVYMLTLMRALRWSGLLRDWPGTIRQQVEAMAAASVDLLKPQVGEIHNIHCWMLAALAEAALLLRDSTLMEWCWSNPVGMKAQIERGFDHDGFWSEGSFVYHFYTLAAVLAFIEASGEPLLPLPDDFQGENAYVSQLKRNQSSVECAKLQKAFRLAGVLAYRDGRLPAYNDGWADICIDGFGDLYEAAFALIPGSVGPDELAAVYRRVGQGPVVPLTRAGVPKLESRSLVPHKRRSLAALLYGPEKVGEREDVAKASCLLPYSGIGILRNDKVRAAMRFGPYAGGHDHFDKLGVDVESASGWQSLDLGTAAYGSAFTHDWQKTSAAHNIVVIDGEPQTGSVGRLLAYTDSMIRAGAADVYRGVEIIRTLSLTEGGWEDVCEMSSARPRRCDWIFHGDGLFVPEGLPGEPVQFEEGNGYKMIAGVRCCRISRAVKGGWRFQNMRTAVTLEAHEGSTLYWGEAMGNPNGRPLGVVILRGTGSEIRIKATFSTDSK